MWNLSAPTRDWAHIPCIARQIVNHWTTREVLPKEFLYETMNMFKWPLWQVKPLFSLGGLSYIFYVFFTSSSAPHSSTLAWKIPWMEEPGRLQSMGSLRVGHDWATSLSLFTFMHWRRKWQPTPVFLPGESQGRGSLVGCRLWGRTESDMTEVT